MTAHLALPALDYVAILPELILLGSALVLLGASALRVRPLPSVAVAGWTAATGVASLVASLVLWHDVEARGPFTAVAHALVVDGFSVVALVLVSCVVVVAALLAEGYLREEELPGVEYHVLALLSASGAMLMAAAGDLIVIFLGLEILSIPLYVLAGLDHRREASGEAAMKYFLLGAFSSAIFVYGIALTYGATGSTNLAEIAAYLAHNVSTSDGLLLAGLGLLVVGFGFKVAAVPFHMWTPDVYQGAPTPATGFMAALAKVGAFAALLRVLVSTFGLLRADWQPILWVAAAASLLVGAIGGVVQRDVKRMLAYSSINHAGFVLVGVQAATAAGVAGGLYYLFAYAFLVLGSFAVVGVVAGRGDAHHDLDRYRGLARRQPVLALAFALLLMAQAGVPFTTGFLAKLSVVDASVRAHSYALAVVAMLSGAIAAFYYLRVLVLMYGAAPAAAEEAGADHEVEPVLAAVPASAVVEGGDGVALAAGGAAPAVSAAPAEPARARGEGRVRVAPSIAVGIACCVGVTVVLGVWPAPLLAFAHAARLVV